MKCSSPQPKRATGTGKLPRRKRRAERWLVSLAFLTVAPLLRAQQSAEVTATDKETMQVLLQRIAQLEAKVEKMEQLEARVKEL